MGFFVLQIEMTYYSNPLRILMDIEATGEVSRAQGVDFYFNGYGYPTNVNFVVEAQGIAQIMDITIMYAN